MMDITALLRENIGFDIGHHVLVPTRVLSYTGSMCFGLTRLLDYPSFNRLGEGKAAAIELGSVAGTPTLWLAL